MENFDFVPPIPRRSRITQEVMVAKSIKEKDTEAPVRHKSPLFYLGIGMLVMILFILSVYVGWPIIQIPIDDFRYGYPRTTQYDTWVGHNESDGTPTHFLATNLHGQVVVIEYPGGSIKEGRSILGPRIYGPNSDHVTPFLEFPDLNGDGLRDMVITVGETRFPLINDKTSFRPPKFGEVQQQT